MAIYGGCWFFLSLATLALSEQCPCELDFEHDGKMISYLEHFAKNKMEKCCRNHGPDFSSWGNACPESFEEIYKEINEAHGWKSGQDFLITDKFVIKEVADHEAKSIDAILANMSQSKNSEESLIAPICRRIHVTQPGGSHAVTVTIGLNLQIKNSHRLSKALLFNLKGNYGFRKRNAVAGAETLEDADFWKKFPSGVHITDSSLLEDMEKRIVSDTKMLNEFGYIDYFLLLQMVELCEHPATACPSRYIVTTPGSSPEQFRKACVRPDKEHQGRPVYVNDKKEFMYYYHNAWRIGEDIYNVDATLFVETSSQCPNAKVQWAMRVGDQSRGVIVTLEKNDIQPEFLIQSKAAIQKANPHVPLAFAIASTKEGEKTYVISYALVDLFQQESSKGAILKDYGNQLGKLATGAACKQDDMDSLEDFGNGLGKLDTAADCSRQDEMELLEDNGNKPWNLDTAGDCRQDGIDSLDSSPYRARFLMMWNHRVKDAPCLAKNSYFTYFPRIADLQATENCPKGEPACKSLCEHLGLAIPNDPDTCASILDTCRSSTGKAIYGLLRQYGFGHLWTTTQMQLEDLLKKNIWDYQVMHFVNKVHEEIDFMDHVKRAKYASCHVSIKRALDEFEESTNTASDNREARRIQDKGEESYNIRQGKQTQWSLWLALINSYFTPLMTGMQTRWSLWLVLSFGAFVVACLVKSFVARPSSVGRNVGERMRTVSEDASPILTIGGKSCSVTADVGIDMQTALAAKPFQTWVETISKEERIEVSSIRFQSVDMFGKNVGFMKFVANVKVDGKPVPGIVFMRGGSVAILVVLYHEGREHTLVVRQPRVPVSSNNFVEIPAGMLDGDGNFAGVAAKEMQEETGIEISKDDLIDMTHEAHKDRYPGMFPSCGASDEFNRMFLYRKEITAEEMASLDGKLTGVIEEGERIKLQILPLQKLWRVSADAKALVALCLYRKLQEVGRIPKVESREETSSCREDASSHLLQDTIQLPPMLKVELVGETQVRLKTYYEINVTEIGGTTSSILKRYSDFEELHTKLAQIQNIQSLPEMPEKSVARQRFSSSFKAGRKKELAEILLVASSQAAAQPTLREFVTSDFYGSDTSLSRYSLFSTLYAGSVATSSSINVNARLN